MTDERRPGHEDDEPASLDAWGSTWTAPPGLRRATLEAARRRGWVKGGGMSGRGVWMGAAAAAAAVMFVAGFGLGARQARSGGDAVSETRSSAATTAAPEADVAPKFAVFLFEDASYRAPTPDRMMERVKEYGSWARGLAESGRYVTGEKLADDGRFCRLEDGALAASGPQADARRGTLTGYFVIGAASLDEAMEVAKSCPHLKYGGTVEIRRLET
jgi:hypothetical protein